MSDVFTLTNEQKEALARAGVVLCYLHGSVAKGTAREDSDVDVAVLFEHLPKDTIKATAVVVAALEGFVPERELDIAILNEADPLLVQTVASRGMLLYGRSADDRLQLEFCALREYEASRRVVDLGRRLALARVGLKL